jgi:amino acid efflux transporter
MAFGPRLERVTGWLFLSVIPVGLPAALHIATGFGQALFGWHNEQLLLAELGTLAIVWWVGSRRQLQRQPANAGCGADCRARCRYLVGGRYHRKGNSLPGGDDVDHSQLFAALSVMFWCFVGLEAFAHLASEFKQPERDFPAR